MALVGNIDLMSLYFINRGKSSMADGSPRYEEWKSFTFFPIEYTDGLMRMHVLNLDGRKLVKMRRDDESGPTYVKITEKGREFLEEEVGKLDPVYKRILNWRYQGSVERIKRASAASA